MSRSLSLQQIKLLCGQVSFDRGLKYEEAGRVMQVDFNEAERRYDAYVWGSARYSVRIVMDVSGVEDARCSCEARHSQYYCKHIAAVLIHIFNAQQKLEPKPASGAPAPAVRPPEPAFSSRDIQFAKNIISLFDYAPSSAYGGEEASPGSRIPLDVEFICKAVSDFSRSPLLALEMRVGPKRLYIVQRIKEFLGAVEQQLPFVFAKLFTYEPATHAFKPEDEAIIRRLIDITHSESAYRDAFRSAGGGYSLQQDRQLIIPPFAWEELLPLLQAANVKFEQGMREAQGILIEEEAPPLMFDLNPAEGGGLQLDIHGLDRIQVLENYGYVAVDCVLYRTDEASMRRIEELKRMFAYKPAKQVLIPPAQVEPFMDRVIPGLRRIGEVSIAPSVSDRFISPPLEAKLDLDWLNGRLLARLVYEYGDIRIDPLRPEGASARPPGDRILLRDVETESKIMNLIERADFKYNGSELYLDDEDELYRFQFRLLPQLEKLARVNATEVMKAALLQPPAPPKLTIDVDAHTQWLEVSFDMEGIDEEEIRDILRTLVERKPYYRLSSGSFLSLEDEGFQEIARLMDEMDVAGGEIKGARFGLSAVRGLALMNAAPHGQSVRFGRSLRQLLENMRNPDNLDFPVPDSLGGVLREYQKFGYQWLKTLAHYHFGGILADDMGLGKTLQSIAFIESVREEIRSSGLPVLIVSPASLLYNWKSEILKFAPDLRVAVAAGMKQERSTLLEDLGDVDVLVTSYPLLRRDMELYAKQRFYALFLDEAQAIKNHATQTAHAVKMLRAGYRFALTGTPIENSLEELWSLFDAVFPELFGSRRAFAALTREGIAKRVRPFILRRMKSDVLKELPDKIETLQLSELTDEQKKLYVAYLSRLQAETLQSLRTEGFQKSRMRILAGLTRLRQLCCHPSLFVENYEGDSGKLEQLLEIVDEALAGGKRMLIFSQFTSMLQLIREELALRGRSCFYLDGQTPAQERVELCRRYNEGEQDIFLISLRAGGTGLNLTGADTVILYDLWWNPAVEQQAADRAHRIGQKKVVQVIRLVTQGTIEEKMVELQKRKQDLIAEVIQPGEESLSAMTEEDIRELLMI